MASQFPPAASQGAHGAPPAGAPRALVYGAFTRLLNVLGTLLILVMVLAVNADVIGRNLFLYPLPGVLEFVGLSIVAIVFLQMANTLREDRHVANDVLMRHVGAARPRLAAAFHAAFYLIGASLMALIVWFVWPIVLDNYSGGFYRGTAGVIEIPTWPFIAAVVVGAAATGVQYLLLAWRALTQASGRTSA
jgi:TRAP-type C4-dicarboxylate transport system permease small subunit